MNSIITNGVLFYNEKKQKTVKDIAQAELYKTKGINARLLSMPKTLKNTSTWYAVEVTPNVTPNDNLKTNINVEPPKTATTSSQTLSEQIETSCNSITELKNNTANSNELDFNNLTPMCQMFKNLSAAILTYDHALAHQFYIIEQQITDTYHYIEFNNLSASEGYIAYEKLHKILCKRRKCKTQQATLTKFINNNSLNDFHEKISANQYKESSGEIYYVRELKDFLGDSLINNCKQ